MHRRTAFIDQHHGYLTVKLDALAQSVYFSPSFCLWGVPEFMKYDDLEISPVKTVCYLEIMKNLLDMSDLGKVLNLAFLLRNIKRFQK